ncbi:MAG TPA: PKD domain-containing protein [Chitinophagaceae bacterium]|nr:PKD domain-containing protein [Chitinophagaceae bacterium]
MKTTSGIILLAAIVMVQACSNKENNTNSSAKAKFVVSGYDVPIPATVTFFNTSSNATSYKWYFGDGTTSTEFNPTHTYTTIGTYFLKLVANGPSGADSVCKVLYLSNVEPNKSSFSYFMDRCEGIPVNFSFYSLNPQSLYYAWDFGGGITSTEKNPVIQYGATGSYTIKFSSQIGGVRDTITFGIVIN